MPSRYANHLNLGKISNTQVEIVGLGSLGSLIALDLARVGFRKFTLWDYDQVDLTNVGTQAYETDQVGEAKCHALQSLIWNLHPSNPLANLREERYPGGDRPSCTLYCEARTNGLSGRVCVIDHRQPYSQKSKILQEEYRATLSYDDSEVEPQACALNTIIFVSRILSGIMVSQLVKFFVLGELKENQRYQQDTLVDLKLGVTCEGLSKLRTPQELIGQKFDKVLIVVPDNMKTRIETAQLLFHWR